MSLNLLKLGESKEEPKIVRPMVAAVEKTIQAKIDGAADSQDGRLVHSEAKQDRGETITKMSSAEFYQNVGAALKKLAAKDEEEGKEKPKKGINRANLPEFIKKRKEIAEGKDNGDDEEENGKKKPNVLEMLKGKKKGKKEKKEKKEEEEEENGNGEKKSKGKEFIKQLLAKKKEK